MPQPQEFAESIENDTSKALEVQAQIIESLEQCSFSTRDIFCMRLALEEALMNAIKHGNQMDPDKRVSIRWRIDMELATVTVQDEGPGFNPEILPDPTTDENLVAPGGRGVMLMRSFMDEVSYNDQGNAVTIVKRRGTEEE